MSNRRRLPGAASPAVHCAVCGHGIGRARRHVVLRDGRGVCGGCVDAGALVRRLACGHWATAGNTVVQQSGGAAGFVCAWCAGDTFEMKR